MIGVPKEVVPGIYQIEYRFSESTGRSAIKTVYDPARYSDAQMASMANEAVGRAIYQWRRATNSKVPDVQFVNINGIKFEVPISTYRGQVYVPTAFPSAR
ncbi:EndoU domain-containing protein [Amphibiibacter pelophylacis]|uniref:EndoU domain-containing protein n=1 Tax=Amphibiibacter pelophylacis TaxID=1799477 RepID=UPI003BFA7606